MLRSMTGFGSASSNEDGITLHVEVRTVNNKFFKTNIRLPEVFQGLESEIESRISSYLIRGSIVVTVKYANSSAESAATINVDAIKEYITQLREVDSDTTIDVARLLSLPGALIQDMGDSLTEKVKPRLMLLLEEACDGVVFMRIAEGKTLKTDLDDQNAKISKALAYIKKRAPEIIADYETRLKKRMESLLAEIGKTIATEDIIKEVAVFAEKTDIAEEIKRLEGHLKQFNELTDGLEGDPIGRTLDFLTQEMLREANTIASKCLDGETSRRIVEIKGAIDRIKEQVQNAE